MQACRTHILRSSAIHLACHHGIGARALIAVRRSTPPEMCSDKLDFLALLDTLASLLLAFVLGSFGGFGPAQCGPQRTAGSAPTCWHSPVGAALFANPGQRICDPAWAASCMGSSTWWRRLHRLTGIGFSRHGKPSCEIRQRPGHQHSGHPCGALGREPGRSAARARGPCWSHPWRPFVLAANTLCCVLWSATGIQPVRPGEQHGHQK